MRGHFFLLIVTQIALTTQLFGATIIPETTLTSPTTWYKSGNPYTVAGLVSVDSGASLTIEAGVNIIFDRDTVTNIAGIVVFPGAFMYANGQESDTIYFRGDSRQRNGFVTAYDYVQLNYCRFENMNGSYYGGYGGALELDAKDSSYVDHCMFWRNKSPMRNGGAICVSNSGLSQDPVRATIRNSYFYGNYVTRGGGGGAISLMLSAIADITGCLFDSNFVVAYPTGTGGNAGAIDLYGPYGGSIINNIFINNYAYLGGAIYNENRLQLPVTIKGNLFFHNSAKIGGAVNIGNPVIFTNNTIVENGADSCGGVCFWQPHLQANIANNIIWNNSAPFFPQADGYFTNASAFSCIQGYTNPARSVIDLDPMFMSPSTHNYHLTKNSPCINSGDTLSPLDPDYTRADMGAFYYRLSNGSGDANNDCRVSGQDVVYLVRCFEGNISDLPIKWKADADGNCLSDGMDITYLINYFKGKNSGPFKNTSCEWTPPPPPDQCSW